MIPARVLRVGERIRLIPDGDTYEVARVTPCAAYVFKVYDPPRQVDVTGRDGSVRRIKVSRGPVEPGISRTAFVYRDERTC